MCKHNLLSLTLAIIKTTGSTKIVKSHTGNFSNVYLEHC